VSTPISVSCVKIESEEVMGLYITLTTPTCTLSLSHSLAPFFLLSHSLGLSLCVALSHFDNTLSGPLALSLTRSLSRDLSRLSSSLALTHAIQVIERSTKKMQGILVREHAHMFLLR
jgi:hypothetical protein